MMLKTLKILLLLFCGFSMFSCSESKDYEGVFREGSWYVYDIEYHYEFRIPFATLELEELVRSLLEEEKLLFLPGDELVFYKRHIDVKYPGMETFSYDFYYWGDYIRVGSFNSFFYNLLPQGDFEQLDLVFDKYSLIALIEDFCEEDDRYDYLLDDLENLRRNFYITYHLQRSIPEDFEPEEDDFISSRAKFLSNIRPDR